MTTFDQRNQKVSGNQYNAGGDMHINHQTETPDLVEELRKVLQSVTQAVQNGELDEELGIDVEGKVKKAIMQANKNEPEKKNSMLQHLLEAKALIEGVTSATGLVVTLTKAVDLIRGL